jgi:hypothetical protein
MTSIALPLMPGSERDTMRREGETESTYSLRTACQYVMAHTPEKVQQWLAQIRKEWNPPDCDWSVCPSE